MATPSIPEKTCTKCGVSYPATLEYFHKDGRSGLRSRCKRCVREGRRAYDVTHREERCAYDAAYRAAHREEKRATDAAWYTEHRKERRAYAAAYVVAHREEVNARTRNRYARKRAAEGKHTAADVVAQLKRQKGRCYYAACGHCKLGDTYHVDHVIPLTRAGARNDISNLVIACPSCNQSKSNKLPHEWTQGGRLL